MFRWGLSSIVEIQRYRQRIGIYPNRVRQLSLFVPKRHISPQLRNRIIVCELIGPERFVSLPVSFAGIPEDGAEVRILTQNVRSRR